MEKIFAIIGMILCIGITYLLSDRKKEINWISVGCAFIGQILLALLFIKTPLWKVIEWLSNGVTWLLAQANEGINFVFGGLIPDGGFVFFINSLMPIVFISGLMGLLFHFGIIQKCISVVGLTVAKILKVDTLVAVNGITNMFLGQTDALFVTKAYLPSTKDSVIFATLVGGMTSISVSVVGLYASYGAAMEWIIVSMPLTVLSTFALTQILMPTQYKDVKDMQIDTSDKGINVIETMINYATGGFKSVIGISIALMLFLSLVYMINNLLGLFFDNVTLQGIIGTFFTPLALLMGVPKAEVMELAQILATKLVTNEAVAITLPVFATLSIKAKAMATVSLMGFAGVGSIAMLVGGYSAVAPNKVSVVAKLGVKALLTATAVNMLTGAVVGLFL